jgi:hypothetical protein
MMFRSAAIMRTQGKARFCRPFCIQPMKEEFMPHTSLAAHRDAPVICANPSWGRRMKRRSRQQKYCSDRCGQMARHWRQSPVLTRDTGRDRTPQKRQLYQCPARAKIDTEDRQNGPADDVRCCKAKLPHPIPESVAVKAHPHTKILGNVEDASVCPTCLHLELVALRRERSSERIVASLRAK